MNISNGVAMVPTLGWKNGDPRDLLCREWKNHKARNTMYFEVMPRSSLATTAAPPVVVTTPWDPNVNSFVTNKELALRSVIAFWS